MNSETDLDTAESRMTYADMAALNGSGLRGAGVVGAGSGLRAGNQGAYRNMMLLSNSRLGQSRAVNAAAALAAANKAGGVLAGSNAAAAALGATGGGAAGGGGMLSTDYDDYGGATAPATLVNNRRTATNYADNLGLSGYGGGGGTTGLLNRGYGGGVGSGYGGGGSGYGGGGGYSPVNLASGYGPGVCEDKGLSPALVLATLAAAAVAFAVIYRQITSGGRKFKKPPTSVQDYVDILADLIWSGEYFLSDDPLLIRKLCRLSPSKKILELKDTLFFYCNRKIRVIYSSTVI